MWPGVVVLAVCVLISCKQPPAAPPAGGAGSATTVVAPATGSGSGSAAPAAGLAFDDGLVGASIELAKPGYKIPFTVFAVFDRAADGAWSLVHIHFAA